MNIRIREPVFIFLWSFGACISPAATLLVYNNNDVGAGSLRQAINDNNASGGGNTIVFSNVVTGTISLASELVVATNVSIIGPGADLLTVNGNASSRIFRILASTCDISGLTIANGSRPTSAGGAISNAATLTLSNCVVSGSSAGIGGGIFNAGSLRAINSSIQNNSAANPGGGIYNGGGLTLIGCSVVSNSTSSGTFTGSGIHGGGNLTNCTIAANSGADGALFGTFQLRNSTISGNTGFGVNGGGSVGNCIIAGNGVNSDVFGSFTSVGFNLIGRTNLSSGWGALGDQLGSQASPLNANLQPLGFYGGRTMTRPPAPGSPAIDQGTNFGPPTDQRGAPRSFDSPEPNSAFGDLTDIGAVESGAFTLLVVNTNDNGSGSLRAALTSAAARDQIGFASNVTNAILLTSGELPIQHDVTIAGPGAKQLAVSGNNVSRVFYLFSGNSAAISGLTICDGRVVGSTGNPGQNGSNERGGGIMNEATLTLTDCIISNNAVIGGAGGNDDGFGFGGGGGNASGGGIANIGTLMLMRCTVISNSAAGGTGGSATSSPGQGGQGYGGGFHNASTATWIQCTVAGNNATGGAGPGGPGSGSGGGLYNDLTLALTNCTVAENLAGGSSFDFGGGIYDNGTALTLRSCTVAGNQADFGGGLNTSGANLGNTILAGNIASSGPDASGTINSSDYNLVQNTSGVTFAGTTTHNLTGLNPLLGALADNGGLSATMAPLAGSPVIDKGKSFGQTTDERGAPRPFDFTTIANAAAGDGSDIGAFESGSPILTVQKLGNAAVLSWPAYYGGFTVQSVTNVNLTNGWATVPGTPLVNGNQYLLTNAPITGTKFYRLKGN